MDSTLAVVPVQVTFFFLHLKVTLVAEERDKNINRVLELEASIAELKNAAGESCPLTSEASRFLGVNLGL